MRPRHICFGIKKKGQKLINDHHQEKKKIEKGKRTAFELVF
jgi:hypothetical protein